MFKLYRKKYSQNGQSAVEFAIIFPLFMLLLIGFVYLSMFCHDYLTLTSVVRDSARLGSMGATEQVLRARYQTGPNQVALMVYTWDPAASTAFDIRLDESEDVNNPAAGHCVRITANATANWRGITVGNTTFTLPPISAVIVMHKEG